MSQRWRWGSVLTFGLCTTHLSFAQSPREPSSEEPDPAIYLELPTLDVNSHGRASYPVPSAQQSLFVSIDGYQLVNHALAHWTGFYEARGSGAVLPGSSVVLANLVLVVLPPGMAWQHEQWHKAALSMHGIESRANTNTVSGVSDESLAALKRDHPADFIRLHTAGLEGGYEAATTLEKLQFFRRTTGWNVPTLWSIYALNSLYMQICSSSLADSDAADAAKQTDILARDIVGSDCTAWTYDLFRPNLPYAARGPHPTGIGLRRYRTYSELTDDERRYLGMQRTLSLLNFLDPALLGITEFRTGGLRFSGHVRHMPTSFGHLLALDGFFSSGRTDWFLSAQQFFNRSHWFPGLLAELWRFPVPTGLGPKLRLSAQLGGWLQPKDQLFATSQARIGGMSSLRIGLSGSLGLEPYVELQAKSAGWAAGILTNDPTVTVRTGVGYSAF
jgi:hypothetical protein